MLSFLFKRPFKTLDRYLIREFTGPFLLAVGGFAIIGIVDILFALADFFIISGLSLFVTLRLLIYKLPGVMVLFFPMAVLFAVMLLLVRMAKDHELVILRTNGITTPRILLPIFIMLCLTGIASYQINEKVVPWTNEASDKIIREEIQQKAPPQIMDNMIFKDHDDRFFYIKTIDSKKGEMKNILIIDPTNTFPTIITAELAYWDQASWTLIDGQIQEFNQTGLIEATNTFHEMIMHVDDDITSNFSRRKTTQQMDSAELKEKIQNLNKGGLSTRTLRVEYHLKKSVPFACIIFGLIGIAFCINLVSSGKDWWGVIVAICIAVLTVGLYFVMLAISKALAKKGIITPIVGAWAPNVLYGSIAGIAIAYNSAKK